MTIFNFLRRRNDRNGWRAVSPVILSVLLLIQPICTYLYILDANSLEQAFGKLEWLILLIQYAGELFSITPSNSFKFEHKAYQQLINYWKSFVLNLRRTSQWYNVCFVLYWGTNKMLIIMVCKLIMLVCYRYFCLLLFILHCCSVRFHNK